MAARDATFPSRRPYFVVGTSVRIDIPGVSQENVIVEQRGLRMLFFRATSPADLRTNDPEISYIGYVTAELEDYSRVVENGTLKLYFPYSSEASVRFLSPEVRGIDTVSGSRPSISRIIREEMTDISDFIIDELTRVIRNSKEDIRDIIQKSEKFSALSTITPPMEYEHYFIENSILGSGSFCCVYKGHDTRTKENVAFKILPLGSGNNLTRALVRELFALYDNKHPNIVTLKDAYTPKYQLLLVMEGLALNLKDAITRCKSGKYALVVPQVLKQILRGISHLHSRGIIHRDMKPENVVLSEDMITTEVKIADFGFARLLGPDLTPQMTTLTFRAPEILLGAPTYSQPMDMWSIGCIFAEMVDHVVPFSCDQGYDGSHGMIRSIIKRLGTPAQSWPEAMLLNYPDDPDIKDCAERLLCMNPKQRITAKEALEHRYFDECSR